MAPLDTCSPIFHCSTMSVVPAVWNTSSDHKDVAAVVRFNQGASVDQFPRWQGINLLSVFFHLEARSGGLHGASW